MGCITWITNKASAVSRCVRYYSLNDSTLFTWNQQLYPLSNSLLNLTKESIIYHGKFCKSGLANRFAIDSALCISPDTVKLSTDSTVANLSTPYPCNPNGQTYCTYFTNTTQRF